MNKTKNHERGEDAGSRSADLLVLCLPPVARV